MLTHLENGSFMNSGENENGTWVSFYGHNLIKIAGSGPGPENLTFEQTREALHQECLCALKRQLIQRDN